jgi:hypothetical protein
MLVMDSDSPNKEQFLVLLPATVLAGTKQCCYRTYVYDFIDKDTDPKLRLPKPVKLAVPLWER